MDLGGLLSSKELEVLVRGRHQRPQSEYEALVLALLNLIRLILLD